MKIGNFNGGLRNKSFSAVVCFWSLQWMVSFLHAQPIALKPFALLSVHAQLGTPVNRFGSQLKVGITHPNTTVEFNYRLTFAISDWGGRKNFVEHRWSPGIWLMTGKEERSFPYFFSNALYNPYNQPYGIGYHYIWYRDEVQTHQKSGSFSGIIGRLAFAFENDLFAGEGRDRYRTAALDLSYQLTAHQLLHLGFNLWTGETRGAPILEEGSADYPYGYRDLRETLYGLTSHGIIYAGITHRLMVSQYASTRIGWDAEGVRQLLQNRLAHNLSIFPKNWFPHTPQYPMLDERGYPVTLGGTKRRGKPYFSAAINQPLTY